MTTIRGRCDQCGDLSFRVADVTVRARLDRPDFAYRIICLKCGDRIVRPTSPRIAGILMDIGCPIEGWVLPYRGPRTGPPINMADVLEFVLEFDDWSANADG